MNLRSHLVLHYTTYHLAVRTGNLFEVSNVNGQSVHVKVSLVCKHVIALPTPLYVHYEDVFGTTSHPEFLGPTGVNFLRWDKNVIQLECCKVSHVESPQVINDYV